eukprot:GEMP01021335.1.p1 GENE.GEMP01021335.1~~GEMP01021335.1.p1  ORF type:complete len:423 (+),score=89.13 GEMP01021335.1:165-1433(+)
MADSGAVEALEKINNSVMLIVETMQQSTPDQAGDMVEDLLNECQITHSFLENSAEDVIQKGQVDLFDRIAEAMESYRQTEKKYREWVVAESPTTQTTPVAARGDAIEPQLADIDERLMTSSIPGEMFTTGMTDLDKPAEVQSKKKKKDGKKKKDPKETKDNKDSVGMDQDFWNAWGGEPVPFQEGAAMDASGAWPTVAKIPEQFPSSSAFGAFGDGEKSAPLQRPSIDETATFPQESFPRLVEQPLPPATSPTVGQHSSATPLTRPQSAIFGQEEPYPKQPSGVFGQDEPFASPFRVSQTPQSIGPTKMMERQPSVVSPLPPPYEGETQKISHGLRVDESPPGSGWRSPRSQRSAGIPTKQDKAIEEVPGTITVQLRMPRIQHFDDLPSSFSTLFAQELSEALNISESRIKVLGVTPSAQTG